MSDPEIKLDAEDVKIERIPRLECDQCGDKATHHVFVDFRSVGERQQVGGNLCKQCATHAANRIKDGLKT